jgi:putative Mg2+ transporter-C (MgtC) family protein
MHIDHQTILLRVIVAFVCGALLGLEREYRGREAGLKSHSILSVACCLAILISAFGFSDAVATGLITLDPSRVAAGVEGGIGFACAAVIWRSRNKVKGLTTAINIWATSNIGMACGAGMFFATAIIMACILFIHLVVGPVEHRIFRYRKACNITISAEAGGPNLIENIGKLVDGAGITIQALHAAQGGPGQPATIELELGRTPEGAYFHLLDSLKEIAGVTDVSCSELTTHDP